MARDPIKVRSRLRAQQVQPVSMPIAASLAYHQLTGHLGKPDNQEQYDKALNDAATALSQVADVYYENEQGRILRIPEEDLSLGTFAGGAKEFKTSFGLVYRALSMRRAEVTDAIEILRKARAALDSARRAQKIEGSQRHES